MSLGNPHVHKALQLSEQPGNFADCILSKGFWVSALSEAHQHGAGL